MEPPGIHPPAKCQTVEPFEKALQNALPVPGDCMALEQPRLGWVWDPEPRAILPPLHPDPPVPCPAQLKGALPQDGKRGLQQANLANGSLGIISA